MTGNYQHGYGPNFAWTEKSSYGRVGCEQSIWDNTQGVDGPAASDDNLYFCGSPTFDGQVSSANPFWASLSQNYYWLWDKVQHKCSSHPHFGGDGHINRMPLLNLPNLTTYGALAKRDSSNDFGCFYDGPTTFVFHKNGEVQVSSPNTNVNSLPVGCPLGSSRTSFGTGFDGAVYVSGQSSAGDSCYASTGPPPPIGFGGAEFYLGYGLPSGANEGFNGNAEPPAPSVGAPPNSPSNWVLPWATKDDYPVTPSNGVWGKHVSCAGDLYVQGTVNDLSRLTLAAQHDVYLTGSLCVPDDTPCQESNKTGSSSYGNSMSSSDFDYTNGTGSGNLELSSYVPPGSPLIGLAAGASVKVYNPDYEQLNTGQEAAQCFNFETYDYSPPTQCDFRKDFASPDFHFTWPTIQWPSISSCWCSPPISVSGGSFSPGSAYLEIPVVTVGEVYTEGALDGYPHRNVVVDAVVYSYKGGLTVSNLEGAASYGDTEAAMSQADPLLQAFETGISDFESATGLSGWSGLLTIALDALDNQSQLIGYVADAVASLLLDQGHGPGKLVVNGAVVGRYAPNVDCSLVTVGLLGEFMNENLTGCNVPTALELPLYFELEAGFYGTFSASVLGYSWSATVGCYLTDVDIILPGEHCPAANVGNPQPGTYGICPTDVQQPTIPNPPSNPLSQYDKLWGPIWKYGRNPYTTFGTSVAGTGVTLTLGAAFCAFLDSYQLLVSHRVGYDPLYVYNPVIANGLPPGFPSPVPVTSVTGAVSGNGTVGYFNFTTNKVVNEPVSYYFDSKALAGDDLIG